MEDRVLGILILILWSLFAFWFSYKHQLFQKRSNSFVRVNRFIFGYLTFFVFVLYLAVKMVFVPLIAQLWLCDLSKHCQVSIEEAVWAVDTAFLLSGLAVIGVSLNSFIRPFIWGEGPILTKWRKGIGWIFIAYPTSILFGILVSLGVQLVMNYMPSPQIAVQFVRELKDFPPLLVLNMIFITTLIPVTEEILFRGFLYSFLKQIFPFKWALFISASIFALFHFDSSQSYSNFEILSSLWMMGMYLGWVYERENSLWAPIGLHMIFNFVGLIGIIFT